MWKFILSTILLSLGILPTYKNINIPQKVLQKLETKLEEVLPSPDLTVVSNHYASPKPSVSPGNERAEVYNTKSGKTITISEEGAEHGKPFITCSQQPELCSPNPTYIPEPIATPTPDPTIVPVASPSPIAIVSPLPTIEPEPIEPPSFPCDCDFMKNKHMPCYCLEVPPPIN